MDRVLAGGGDGAPGLAAAGAALVLLSMLFAWSGAFWPTDLPAYADSPRQITGMALMLVLLPAYMLAAWSIGQRRSLQLVERIRPLLSDAGDADRARAAIRAGLRSSWPWGLALGILLGLLNTEPLRVLVSPLPRLEGAISLGQIVLWSCIGLVLGVRFSTVRIVRGIGDQIDFDLFQLERLRPLAQAGMVDVAIVAGAVLFTPLQSLDAEFRWVNYQFPLVLAPPISAFLLLWPLMPIHRRIVAERDARLAAIDVALAAHARTPADAEAVRGLETLLAHRDRLREASTWPLSMRLLSRVVVYLVIPPIAWAGAALVERLVEGAIAGSGP